MRFFPTKRAVFIAMPAYALLIAAMRSMRFVLVAQAIERVAPCAEFASMQALVDDRVAASRHSICHLSMVATPEIDRHSDFRRNDGPGLPELSRHPVYPALDAAHNSGEYTT